AGRNQSEAGRNRTSPTGPPSRDAYQRWMTAEFPFLSVLGLGFLLGAKHALDADHVVAISTIASEQRGLGRACAIGFCWGIGHTLVLLFAGLAVLGFPGSACLLLLVSAAARSVRDGLLYIMPFGAGSIAAMVLLGVMLSLPFVFTPVHLVRTHLALRALAGLVSVSLGGLILYESVVL